MPAVDPLAAYGAMVSTLAVFIGLGSLAWNIHLGRRDGPKIAFTVKFVFDFAAQPQGWYIKFTMINSGRRPVSFPSVVYWQLPKDCRNADGKPIMTWFLDRTNGTSVMEVGENKSWTWNVAFDLFSPPPEHMRPRRFWMLDVTGRQYEARTPQKLVEAMKEAERFRMPSSPLTFASEAPANEVEAS
jgi:hypothetical protein